MKIDFFLCFLKLEVWYLEVALKSRFCPSCISVFCNLWQLAVPLRSWNEAFQCPHWLRINHLLGLSFAESGVFSLCFVFHVRAEFLCLVDQFYNLGIYSGLITVLSVCDVALSKSHPCVVYPRGLVGVEWICFGSWCFSPLDRPTSDLRIPCVGWHTPTCREAAPRQHCLRPVLRASLGPYCSSGFAWQFCPGCRDWGVLIASLVQVLVLASVCFF